MDEDLIKIQERMVLEHHRNENLEAWDKVFRDYIDAESSFQDLVPLSVRFKGIQGAKQAYSILRGGFTDIGFEITNMAHTPGFTMIELTLSGRHHGEFLGVKPTNRRMAVECAAVFQFATEGPNRGLIMGERVYFDVETILCQLRGDASRPTRIGLSSMPHPKFDDGYKHR